MNNEKKYLAKTAALISDKSVDNQLGVMFANVKANKKVYIAKADVKNVEKELYFVKTNVCKYCHDVFDFYASMSNDKAAELFKNSAEYYNYAMQKNLSAEEIYTTSKQISEAQQNLSYTKQEDMELTK